MSRASSRQVRKYIRVYYEFSDEYPELYDNDATLAAWVRLLAIADAAWPSQPELPRSIKPKPLAQLVEAGVVMLHGHRFRIKGHHAERERRSDASRNAAASRWHDDGTAERTATGTAETMPSRARAEQSIDRGSTEALGVVGTRSAAGQPLRGTA